MKSFLFSILLIVTLPGCSPYLFNNYREAPDKSLAKAETYSWFAEKNRSYRFNASIKFYSHEYSSIVIIKQLKEESYRALMVTELGIKICDLEIFSSGDYKLHYCIEQMNRKGIIKLLADCLDIMIYPVPEKGKQKMLKEKHGERLIIRSKHKGGPLYTFIDPFRGKADEIRESGYLFSKLNFILSDSGSGELESADIFHSIIKLNIHFSKLSDEKN